MRNPFDSVQAASDTSESPGCGRTLLRGAPKPSIAQEEPDVAIEPMVRPDDRGPSPL